MAHSEENNPVRVAQNAADQLATSLEEAGFDVGREFPGLQGTLDLGNAPAVDLGRISAESAINLACTLTEAAGLGVTRCNED